MCSDDFFGRFWTAFGRFRMFSDGFRMLSDGFRMFSNDEHRRSNAVSFRFVSVRTFSDGFRMFSNGFWLSWTLILTAFRYRERRFADRPYPFLFSFLFGREAPKKKCMKQTNNAGRTSKNAGRTSKLSNLLRVKTSPNVD